MKSSLRAVLEFQDSVVTRSPSTTEIERIIDSRLPAEAGLPTWWAQCPGLGECGESTAWRVAGMPGHYLIELVAARNRRLGMR